MSTLGQVLKGKRERLGMTLAELEARTKIRRETLILLERDDFKSLTQSNYTEGFVIKYAQAVNLDARQLIQSHRDELPNTAVEMNALIEAFSDEDTLPDYKTKDKEALQLSVLLVGFIFITGFIWTLLVLIF